MKQRRTSEQWQQLFAQRAHFDGSNIEFCKQHNISITTYYKHRTLFQSQTPSDFVQVKTTTEQTQVIQSGAIQFDTHSGRLTFSAHVPPEQVVDIIKGLSQ